MSAKQKDKRTKEQILHLLDNAIEQEERLGEKIKSLETELADCRKKAEDPRHELTEGALSASKVSFRLDYYRTDKDGPLKGIVEHLPTRETKSFEGEGQEAIGQFVARFLSEETSDAKNKKKKGAEGKKGKKEPVIALSAERELSPARKIEINIAEAEGENIGGARAEEIKNIYAAPEEAGNQQQTARFDDEDNVLTKEQPGSTPAEEQKTSRLLQRLKAEVANKTDIPDEAGKPSTEIEEQSMRSERMQRILERIAANEALPPPAQFVRAEEIPIQPAAGRSRLLERIREEYNKSL